MPGLEALYQFVTEDNRFLKPSEAGDSVVLVSTPYSLQNNPDGWQNITIQRQRSDKYFAMQRSFSLPLNFVKDGAFILKDAYYKNGLEYKIYLQIVTKRLLWERNYGYLVDEQGNPLVDQNGNPITTEGIGYFGFYWSRLYKGPIDFSQFNHSGPKVSVNIMEGAASKLVNAFENTKYALDFIDPITIQWTGIRLRQKAGFIITNGNLPNDVGGHTMSVQYAFSEAVNTTGDDSSFTSIGAVSQDRVKTGNSINLLWNTGEFFLESGSQPSSLTLNWNFHMTPSLVPGVGAIYGTSIIFKLHVLAAEDNQVLQVDLQYVGGNDPLSLYNHSQQFNGTWSGTIPANCRCILYMSANQNRELTSFSYDNTDGNFDIQYTYVKDTTYVKALRLNSILKLIADKMGISEIQSDLYEKYNDIVITSGDAIRGLENSKIKLSLSDLFSGSNTAFGSGLSTEDTLLRIEDKSYYVDLENEPIDLGVVDISSSKPAINFNFNTLKIGWPVKTYNDVNGRQEFNTTAQYTSAITVIAKELNLVSPTIRADCYGAEYVRINLDGKTTTDSNSDNDVWFIHINKSSTSLNGIADVYGLNRSQNPYVTGLLEPDSVFNVFLSPAQCLLRQKSFIRSCFYKMDQTALIFQQSDKNSSMVISMPNSEVIKENANIQIQKLGSRLFIPHQVDVKTKVPVNILAQLETNPKKSYQFTTVLGDTFLGIPQKDSVEPISEAAQTFTLLCGPDSDLTKLIPFNG